ARCVKGRTPRHERAVFIVAFTSVVGFGFRSGKLKRVNVFRFAPESGHRPTRRACLLGAMNGLKHCNKRDVSIGYSIISSARPSNGNGKVRPSVLAVLRLTTNSTFTAS